MATKQPYAVMNKTDDIILWEDLHSLYDQIANTIVLTMVSPLVTHTRNEDTTNKKLEVLNTVREKGVTYAEMLKEVYKGIEDKDRKGQVDISNQQEFGLYVSTLSAMSDISALVSRDMLGPVEELAKMDIPDLEKEKEESKNE